MTFFYLSKMNYPIDRTAFKAGHGSRSAPYVEAGDRYYIVSLLLFLHSHLEFVNVWTWL